METIQYPCGRDVIERHLQIHLRARLPGPTVGQAQRVDVRAVQRPQLGADPRLLGTQVRQRLGPGRAGHLV